MRSIRFFLLAASNSTVIFFNLQFHYFQIQKTIGSRQMLWPGALEIRFWFDLNVKTNKTKHNAIEFWQFVS